MSRKSVLCGTVLVGILTSVLSAHAADNPLVRAIEAGDDATVKSLIGGQPALANTVEADGSTALHWAVRANNPALVEMLLRAGAKAGAANRYGVTPLSVAATNGNAQIAKMLIQAGADVNAALHQGETVLMTASRTGTPEVMRALIAAGANIKAREKGAGETALIWAAAENHAAAIKVLLEAGADVDEPSPWTQYPYNEFSTPGNVTTYLPRGGWTPLMYAARQGAKDAVLALLDGKADVNAVDPDESTPLALAILNAHFDVAALLLERGADPNRLDVTGTGPLYAVVDMSTLDPMYSRPSPVPSGSVTALELARRLIERGADVNAALWTPVLQRHHAPGSGAMGEGTTPFMRAAKNGDVPMMKLLLAHGADPKALQKSGNNALMIAAAPSGSAFGAGAGIVSDDASMTAIQLLLDHGISVDATNRRGETALHLAAGAGRNGVIQYLVDHGARLDVTNEQGRIPLDIAVSRTQGLNPREGTQATVALLRKLMADRGVTPAAKQQN